jgi:hypothetical protein
MQTIALAVLGLLCVAGTSTAQADDPRAVPPTKTARDSAPKTEPDPLAQIDPPLPLIDPDQPWPPKEMSKQPSAERADSIRPTQDTVDRGMTWEDVGDICLIVLVSCVCFAGFLFFLSGLQRR